MVGFTTKLSPTQRTTVQKSFHIEIGVPTSNLASTTVNNKQECVMVPASPTGNTSTQNDAPSVEMDINAAANTDRPWKEKTRIITLSSRGVRRFTFLSLGRIGSGWHNLGMKKMSTMRMERERWKSKGERLAYWIRLYMAV